MDLKTGIITYCITNLEVVVHRGCRNPQELKNSVSFLDFQC